MIPKSIMPYRGQGPSYTCNTICHWTDLDPTNVLATITSKSVQRFQPKCTNVTDDRQIDLATEKRVVINGIAQNDSAYKH